MKNMPSNMTQFNLNFPTQISITNFEFKQRKENENAIPTSNVLILYESMDTTKIIVKNIKMHLDKN